MLTIRKEQVNVFQEQSMESFIYEMVEHLKSNFPEESSQLSDQELKEFINKSMMKAKDYKLVSERDVCKFLNLTLVFGINFDRKIDTLWIHKMLSDDKESNPSIRLNACYKEAIKQLESKESEKRNTHVS